MANDMKSELVDPCFDELSRWAESDEFLMQWTPQPGQEIRMGRRCVTPRRSFETG